MLGHLVTYPFYIILAYFVYLVVKPASVDDRYFDNFYENNLENIIGKIRMLSDHRRKLMKGEMEKVEDLFWKAEKRRFSPVYRSALDDYLTEIYFNHFYSRWAAFRRADLFHKIVLLAMMIQGFVVFITLICYVRMENGESLEDALPVTIIISLVLFIVPLLFSFLVIGLVSILLTGLSLVMPNDGRIKRAVVITDEFVRSLKPGGRNTPVDLANYDD